MKTIVMTSALTFVPDNYDGFVLPLAQSPHVTGLVVLENRGFVYFAQAVALIVTLAAPALGWSLLKNFFGGSLRRRRSAFEGAGKKVWVFNEPHSAECLELLQNENPDLILNARTRFIFRKKLLATPKLGCVNIHHGLLPDQRGLMCDFWAHLSGEETGFSIHVMTPKLDDGPIIKAVPVKTDQKDYLESLEKGARLEAQTCLSLLEEIARSGKIDGTPNRSEKAVYRRNPGLADFYRMKRKGIRI